MVIIEIAFRTIIVAVIATIVLMFFSFFFFSSSGEQFTQAKANEVFFSRCETYKGQKCDWRVTYQKDFKNFYAACRQLNGPDVGKFTCLYKLCCASSEDVTCDGLCELCSGHENLGITLEQCCARYQSSCSSSPSRCGVCGAG